jgi:hypothetical protein
LDDIFNAGLSETHLCYDWLTETLRDLKYLKLSRPRLLETGHSILIEYTGGKDSLVRVNSVANKGDVFNKENPNN